MSTDYIDKDGYRANVGIIICNAEDRLLWARRNGQRGWQFPQGGILQSESALDAMYRELHEEIGLDSDDVELLARSKSWMRYRLPPRYRRKDGNPVCIGQKQRWFLLRLIGDDGRVRLDRAESPEFDGWRWVDYWYPPANVIFFKRRVYRRALREFQPVLFPVVAEGASERLDDRKRDDANQ